MSRVGAATLGAVIVALATLGAATALAGEDDCLDFDRTPLLKWEVCDAYISGKPSHCADFNEATGSSIVCRYDHPSIEKRAKEMVSLKPPLQSTLLIYDCNTALQYLLENQGGLSNVGGFLLKGKPLKEFQAKVKTITCAYDSNKVPSVQLVGTDLVIKTPAILPGGRAHPGSEGDGYVLKGMRDAKAFPEFAAAYEKAH